jgi:hypothetical protein
VLLPSKYHCIRLPTKKPHNLKGAFVRAASPNGCKEDLTASLLTAVRRRLVGSVPSHSPSTPCWPLARANLCRHPPRRCPSRHHALQSGPSRRCRSGHERSYARSSRKGQNRNRRSVRPPKSLRSLSARWRAHAARPVAAAGLKWVHEPLALRRFLKLQLLFDGYGSSATGVRTHCGHLPKA